MPAEERILDASAIAAVLFGEEGFAGVLKRVGQASMVGPTLLPYELASVCAKKKKADPHRAASADGILQGFADLPVELIPVSASAAAQFADLFKLSPYDAAYLHLAMQRNSPLVTLDANLGKAAKKLGLLA